jgi:NAD(P)-dependent dehydrogenase (short-subunit alcohol dehydrogenase family)
LILTTGIGYETAINIASMGGTVVLACRDIHKAQLAREEIVRTTNCRKENVIVLKLDLSFLSSIRQFVDEFRALKLPLHALINNAGVMLSSRQLTADGLEKDFMVNYLGHFLLTNLLLPELELTNGRVVNVSSSMHKLKTRFDFDNVMAEKSFSLFGTYAQSKLAMILFTRELQRRLGCMIRDKVP